MSNITFTVLTYNEEKRVSYAIKNLIKYGDVIIFDGGSTDKTKEIAEKMGAKFVTRPKNDGVFMENKENYDFLKSIVKTDFIYWGFVDNILSKNLLEKLTDVSNKNTTKIVYAPLFTYLWGNTKNYAHKSHIPVLYHKDYMSFSNPHIHSMGDFTGTKSETLILPLKEEFAVKHFSTYTSHKFILGHLRYAETEAEEKFNNGKKFSGLRMFAAMLRYMWMYGKYSYKNGSEGLITIFHYATFRLMTYAKLYELEHKITLDNIEKHYSSEKEKLLKDF